MGQSKPYYGPDEDPATILIEQTFLAGDFIAGVGYGAQLVLWTKCVIHLWKARKTQRWSRFLLGYIILLMSVETTYMVAQAYTVQDVYIDNRNYPGGPWEYFLATQWKAENVIFCATFYLITFLSDLLVLWRCWVIWSVGSRKAAYAAIALPALMLLASFGLGTLWTLETASTTLYGWSAIEMGTAYYPISLGVNIILTALIIFCLLVYRRRIRTYFPNERAQHYLSLSSIVIESASLYSILALTFVITYGLNSPMNQPFLGAATVSQQIAGYLIILRVSEGKAWERNSDALNSLQLPDIETIVDLGPPPPLAPPPQKKYG